MQKPIPPRFPDKPSEPKSEGSGCFIVALLGVLGLICLIVSMKDGLKDFPWMIIGMIIVLLLIGFSYKTSKWDYASDTKKYPEKMKDYESKMINYKKEKKEYEEKLAEYEKENKIKEGNRSRKYDDDDLPF